MRWEGSLQNRLMELWKTPEPVVGMGVTECQWSDRTPWEIIQVIDDRHIIVRELDAKRVDRNGLSEMQEYEYSSNPENRTAKLFMTKQGHWRECVGRSLGCTKFVLGRAEKYWDPTF